MYFLWTTTTPQPSILRLFFRDHPGEPVPEETFWTLWCKRRLTEADILTIWLGATPSGLTTVHLHHLPIFFYRPDALPAAQPIVSKHWKQMYFLCNTYEFSCWKHCLFLYDSCLTLVPVQTGCDSQIHLKYNAVGLTVSVIIASCSCLDKHCTAASCIVPECQFELHIRVVQYCFLTTIMPYCVHSFLVFSRSTNVDCSEAADWCWMILGGSRIWEGAGVYLATP